MNDLSIATDRTPLLERKSGYGTQSGQEEVRNESIGTRIYNALAWFFNLINPFSCCMSPAQDVEVSDQSDIMERGELASRVDLPPPRGVLEEQQVREKEYEIIDLGKGHSLKLEIRPSVPISSNVEVRREERVVAKPVDFPAERTHIRKLEREVAKLESRFVQIDRELANPSLKKTSTFEISKMLEAQSTMGELVDVLVANRRIDGLTWERPAVERELSIARDNLRDFREWVNLPEVV